MLKLSLKMRLLSVLAIEQHKEELLLLDCITWPLGRLLRLLAEIISQITIVPFLGVLKMYRLGHIVLRSGMLIMRRRFTQLRWEIKI
ncbi:hypothetical protein GCWU000246_01594 [Jonquetella anthropi E3_33 E1]|nr:hypothetical protein GCWU000246_01594 [Jonquetella anthropi E3_33 E1]